MDALEIPLNPPSIKGEELKFDAILFDAPCSSEGKINLHSEKTYNGWEEKYIGFNYKRQKAIIEKNVRLLKS
jgi:16S rRNA C967 or C1407 C5-methylase (RsmB/RsmF family)